MKAKLNSITERRTNLPEWTPLGVAVEGKKKYLGRNLPAMEELTEIFVGRSFFNQFLHLILDR